jgi:hypothetical protein
VQDDSVELIPFGHDAFGDADESLRITFSADSTGVSGFTVTAGGQTMRARRVGEAP